MSYRHLSPALLRKLDDEIEAGIQRVRDDPDGTATADVSLAFKIGLDKDGVLLVNFTNKHSDTEKGSFQPSRQPRLALAE